MIKQSKIGRWLSLFATFGIFTLMGHPTFGGWVALFTLIGFCTFKLFELKERIQAEPITVNATVIKNYRVPTIRNSRHEIAFRLDTNEILEFRVNVFQGPNFPLHASGKLTHKKGKWILNFTPDENIKNKVRKRALINY